MIERPDGAARKLPPELARLLHDLRGPLNSAVMHLEVLKRTVADDPSSAESLRTVLQQLVRLSEMLPAAFAVAALEPDAPTHVSLRETLNRAFTFVNADLVLRTPQPVLLRELSWSRG